MTLPVSPSERSYGRIKDVPDHRDNVMRFPAMTLPPSADLGSTFGPVRDQGQEGSCVGHGWAAHADWLFHWYGKHHHALDFSPAYFYYLCRQLEGTLPDDAGAQVRTGAKVFNQFGALLEAGDAYSYSTMNVGPSLELLTAAQAYKGGAYHTLLTLQDMKACIYSGYGFVDGIMVYDSFESDAVAASGEVPMPNVNNEQLLGGHCTFTFGYNDNHKCADGSVGALHKRNSWGRSWGQDGNFWLPYGFVTQGLLTDAWMLHLGPAWVPKS